MEGVDVAIVGGGPAGSGAARAAAEAGADVRVLEKGVPRADREGIGPDSTDAAGLLDYWLDVLGFSRSDFPDDVLLRELDGAQFLGPRETLTIHRTGVSASCDTFGFTFHRARFDDWLRDRAERAGATYQIGTSVSEVETDLSSDYRHTLHMADGDQLATDYVILADGPQRTVTTGALDQFMPGDRSVSEYLAPDRANHIAYQEYRRIPDELYDPNLLKFWWGLIPGHTAYPWIFPNDGNVARVGLTMPIDVELDDVEDRHKYALLDPEDEQIPSGRVYLRRLLEREYPEYDIEDFPLVDDRGKRNGTEAYPISSTRPIESPTRAGIAVAGGAMGTTSAFHEGGDHVAYRTGSIAGRLAAKENLERYNDAWQDAIGPELLRNITFAKVVRGWDPDKWDGAFAAGRAMQEAGGWAWGSAIKAGLTGLKVFASYRWNKRNLRDNYVQLTADEYEY